MHASRYALFPAAVLLLLSLAAPAADTLTHEASAPTLDDEARAKLAARITPTLCRITVENEWRIPVAVTNGFLVGKGIFVLAPLGPLALEGTAKATVQFGDGKPITVTQFGMADPSLGIVALRLTGKGVKHKGIGLASDLPPVEGMGRVFVVQCNDDDEATLLDADISKGPEVIRPVDAAGTTTDETGTTVSGTTGDREDVAAAVSGSASAAEKAEPDEPTSTADTTAAMAGATDDTALEQGEYLCRITKGEADRVPGLPVVDAKGQVVSVIGDMVTRTSVLIGVPAPSLEKAMLASDLTLKDLDDLPDPNWPTPVVRLVGKTPTTEEFTQAVVSAKSRLICPICGGTGVLPHDDGTTPIGTRRPVQRGRYLPRCGACGGSGIVIEAGLMKMLASVTEHGARIVWSPESDSRSRQGVRQGILDLVRAIATAPPARRHLFATYAGRAVSQAARQQPQGLIVYAQVREKTEGPDSPYLMLEPWQSATSITIRLKDLLSGTSTSAGQPAVGSWVYVAGIALSTFDTGLQQGVYVLPVVLIPAPTTP